MTRTTTLKPQAHDIIGIVLAASHFDWLMEIEKSGRRPQPLPPSLHADLGLPPRAPAQDPLGWRRFG
jgi:hypothetical protein